MQVSSSMTDLEGQQQRVFAFRDCHFSVPTKDGDKVILKGVSGEARSGEVLAIMGPSGAGKTQLMNMLTLKPGPGTVSGELTLNGQPFTQTCVSTHPQHLPIMYNPLASARAHDKPDNRRPAIATDKPHLSTKTALSTRPSHRHCHTPATRTDTRRTRRHGRRRKSMRCASTLCGSTMEDSSSGHSPPMHT
jgi:energy-coupling factor transporter ATP-binding protein EcfA2